MATYNTECFCMIKADESLVKLKCGHNIHFSCALEMEKDYCPWCRSKMGVFIDMYLQNGNSLFVSRIIRSRLVCVKQSNEVFVVYNGTIEVESNEVDSSVYTPPPPPSPPPVQENTGEGEISSSEPIYNGPMTRSRRSRN